MLKALMLKRKIDTLKEKLSELNSKDESFKKRESDLESSINEATTDEEQNVVAEEVEKFEKENYDFKTFSASKQSDLLYAYGKEKLNKEETEKLEKLIYEDYLKSGNTRKWHKWIGE